MGSWGEEVQRKRNRKDTITELADDLINEILQKLPVRSLLRFMCVCKLWYSLIISPNIIDMHFMNNDEHKIESSIFCYLSNGSPASVTVNSDPLPETITNTISFRFNGVPVDLRIPVKEPGNFRIVGCSGGGVCLRRGYECYILWNPVTRQYRNINIVEGCISHGFCFDPISNAFKLVHVDILGRHISIITSRDSTMQEKEIDRNVFSEPRGPSTIRFAGCVKRYMYWNVLVEDWNAWSAVMHIVCFDMIDEMFKRIEFPPLGAKKFSSLGYSDYKNSFAMFDHKMADSGIYCASVDVWVFDDGDQSWSKKLTCQPSVSFQRALGVFCKNNVDLLVLSTNSTDDMVLYDPETKRTFECPLEEKEYMSFWYCESFASLY